jgi:hypothetical protein
MKHCPECRRTYEDDTLSFCLSDGARLSERGAETSAAPVVPDLPVPPPMPIPTSPSNPSGFSLPEIPVPPATGPSAPPSVPPLPFPSPPPPGPPSPTYSQPASKQSIPFPLLFVGALLLLLVLGGGNRLLVARKAKPVETPTGTPANPTAAPPFIASPSAPPMDPAPADEASLKTAIRLADAAEIQALSTLDPAPLSQAYTGEALRSELKKLLELKAKGLYVQAHLDNQEVQSIQVSPDASRADVKVIETWSTTFYSTATRQVTQSKTGLSEPQIISLVRSNGNWLVYADNPQ